MSQPTLTDAYMTHLKHFDAKAAELRAMVVDENHLNSESKAFLGATADMLAAAQEMFLVKGVISQTKARLRDQ